MRHRGFVAAGVAAALLGVAGCGGAQTSGNSDNAGKVSAPQTLTVWLQVDAQQNWPQAVKATDQAFEKAHKNVTVQVQYQQWNTHLTKLDAALAGSDPPDVVEMGNTETTKYMASGAFVDLTGQKGSFDNSGNWLKGLTESCTYVGKLYCVPYYAGSRAVIYRTDMFKQADISAPPTTLDAFVADGKKLMAAHRGDPNFSALYFPGKYWYAAMSFVYDYGGQIAVRQGNAWKGTLDSPQARQGLKKLKSIVEALSRASKTGDEATQDKVFAQGHIAQIYANGWEMGAIVDPKTGNPKLKGKLAAYPMPSHVSGGYMPAFLGGSDLAVTAKSDQRKLAIDWIRTYTSTRTETQLAKQGGVIPNTTTLTDVGASDPTLAPFAKAARSSWFVPTAKNWASVEKKQIIPDMLVDIFTGKATVAQATSKASQQISQTLNAS